MSSIPKESRHLNETIDKFNKGCSAYQQAMIAFKEGNLADYETGLLSAAPQVVGALEWTLKIYLRHACRGTEDYPKLRQPTFHDLVSLMEKYADPALEPGTSGQLYDYRDMRNAAEHEANAPSGRYLGQAIDTIRQVMLAYLPIEAGELKMECGSTEESVA